MDAIRARADQQIESNDFLFHQLDFSNGIKLKLNSGRTSSKCPAIFCRIYFDSKLEA